MQRKEINAVSFMKIENNPRVNRNPNVLIITVSGDGLSKVCGYQTRLHNKIKQVE